MTHAQGMRSWFLVFMSTWTCGCGGNLIDAYPEVEVFMPASTLVPDDPFLDASRQSLNEQGTLNVAGELSAEFQMQAWDIGDVPAGTRLIIDIDGRGRNLSAGLFDDRRQVLMVNHDRYPRHNLNPYVVFDVREDLEAMYVVVASDPQESNYGTYGLRVIQASNQPVPETRTQHVVLNFQGADRVTVGSTPATEVKPFDAADLHPSWGGHTEDMVDIVVENMERIYSGLDVRFHLADDLPDGKQLTWVHFGGSHASNVGLASNVDYGNRQMQQTAVVYVENFAKYIKYGYTHQEIAQGFANVAAHELGHLLGCNHSNDPADVMNVSPTVDALVAPQYFVPTAGLDSKVFPTGLQDGVALIIGVVGGNWNVAEATRSQSQDDYLALIPSASIGLKTASSGLIQHADAQSCDHRLPALP